MVDENRFAEQEETEARLVAEFLSQYPPADPLWADGGWLKILKQGADTPELRGAYSRLLLHAAIAVRAAGGPVRDNDISEGLQLFRDG